MSASTELSLVSTAERLLLLMVLTRVGDRTWTLILFDEQMLMEKVASGVATQFGRKACQAMN